jgi:hypothetical protein
MVLSDVFVMGNSLRLRTVRLDGARSIPSGAMAGRGAPGGIAKIAGSAAA